MNRVLMRGGPISGSGTSGGVERGSLRLTPVAGLFAVVAVTNLLSVPMAYLLNAEDFEFLEYRVTQDDILTAYWWTIYAFVALVVLYFALGVHRLVSEYQERPLAEYSADGYSRFWAVTFGAGLLVAVVMFVQAGYQIPLLSAFGQDYVTYSKLRIHFERTINGTLFNVGLYWLGASNVAVAWLHSRSVPRRIASVALFMLLGSFDLARSPIGFALLMILGYRLLWKGISRKALTLGVGAMAGIFVAMHYIAGAPSGYGGMGEYLGVRVFYGQWAGLPYYFSIFQQNHVSWTSLLGPALHAITGNNSSVVEGPARIVMEHMSPDRVYDGSAGVASGFFLGEAYAVAGTQGVVLAPVFVTLQMLIIVHCFRKLEKTTLNMILYSWFLYKIFMGVVTGFSQFVVSLLQVMILVLAYWVMISGVLSRVARRQATGRIV